MWVVAVDPSALVLVNRTCLSHPHPVRKALTILIVLIYQEEIEETTLFQGPEVLELQMEREGLMSGAILEILDHQFHCLALGIVLD
jgi:hypothetical protein